MNKTLSYLLQIGLYTFGYFHVLSQTALTQITTDGTVNTQVNRDENVTRITGGGDKRQ